MKASEGGFNDLSAVFAVTGLRAMRNDVYKVKRVVSALTALVKRCKEPIVQRNISSHIDGQRHMNSNNSDVSDLVDALPRRIKDSPPALDSTRLGNDRLQMDAMNVKSSDALNLKRIRNQESPGRLSTSANIGERLKLLGQMGGVHRKKLSMDELTRRIKNCDEIFFASDVVDSLHIIRGYTEESKELVNLLTALTPKMVACSGTMEVHQVCEILNGMRYFSSDDIGIRNFVKALTCKVKSAPGRWRAQDIGYALSGLQSFDCSSSEILSLLSEIHNKIEISEDAFSSKNICDSFLGLRRKSSKSLEVRKLAVSLGSRIHLSTGSLTNADLKNYFQGILLFEDLFVDRNHLLSSVTLKMALSTTESIDGDCLCSLLYTLKGRSNKRPEVRNLLLAIAKRLEHSSIRLVGKEVAGTLFGMQKMDSNENSLRVLLAALVPLIVTSSNDYSARDVGMALYGLQGMDCKGPEVRAVLSALLPKIQSAKFLDRQAIGNAMYGLQKMTADYPEVAAVVSALAKGMSASQQCLSSQNLGNALYGLKSMSSDRIEVREIVAALVSKVESCQGELAPQELGNSLYGLLEMSSDHVEVRNLLLSLVPKIQGSRGLKGREVSNALYGLRGMSSDHAEVRLVLDALVMRIKECDDDFTEQDLCSALYGLQRMTGDSPEVRRVLSALLVKIESGVKKLGGRGIGSILFGLRGCKETPEAQVILDEVFQRAMALGSSTDEFKQLEITQLRSLCQRLVLFLQVSEGKKQAGDMRWRELMWDLCRELSRRTSDTNVRPTHAELRLHVAVVRALKHSSLKVTTGSYLMNLFESDIVIWVPVRGRAQEPLIVNIEVDGVMHNIERKKSFCDARDAYLNSAGIVVERLEVAAMDKMDESERKDWIIGKIAKAVLTHSLS